MQDYGYIDPRSHLIPCISEVIHCELIPVPFFIHSFFFFFHTSVWHITSFHSKYSYTFFGRDWFTDIHQFWFLDIQKYRKMFFMLQSEGDLYKYNESGAPRLCYTCCAYPARLDTFSTPNRWDTSVLSLLGLSVVSTWKGLQGQGIICFFVAEFWKTASDYNGN